jgi:hypothetical protein
MKDGKVKFGNRKGRRLVDILPADAVAGNGSAGSAAETTSA